MKPNGPDGLDGSINTLRQGEYLGLDAEGLEKEWAKTKPADKIVKFGGEFDPNSARLPCSPAVAFRVDT